jgi:hypothetical protein
MVIAALGVLSFVLGASGLLRSIELVALATTLGLSLLLVALALERDA